MWGLWLSVCRKSMCDNSSVETVLFMTQWHPVLLSHCFPAAASAVLTCNCPRPLQRSLNDYSSGVFIFPAWWSTVLRIAHVTAGCLSLTAQAERGMSVFAANSEAELSHLIYMQQCWNSLYYHLPSLRLWQKQLLGWTHNLVCFVNYFEVVDFLEKS